MGWVVAVIMPFFAYYAGLKDMAQHVRDHYPCVNRVQQD